MMKTEYAIDIATPEQVRHVACRLRSADVQEIQATLGESQSPVVSVVQCWRVSRETTFVGTANSEPVCIFGVRPPCLLNDVAVPWLVGTDAVRKHAYKFLRAGKAIVKIWASQFPVMQNFVDARNELSIRWLQWLGFAIYYPQPFGLLQLPFHRFEMRSRCVD